MNGADNVGASDPGRANRLLRVRKLRSESDYVTHSGAGVPVPARRDGR